MTLKTFQEMAVASGVNLFAHAKTLLDAAPNDPDSRANTVNHNGYLLIEAPTGSGKTLLAGNIVERFSSAEDVVWFWFAPFKGIVGQTVGFLREQFQGLRLRELQEDRAAAGSRRGDVFVTTWQTVATRVKDKRNVRKDGELNPSIDELIKSLRSQGLRIGVVVDEAHHSFHGDTQAAIFFREVLRPEYTILITATPDDADIKEFEKAQGIGELHRIRVSRVDAVSSGLIKAGVKCVAYFVDADKKALVDLEATALHDGVRLHRQLKKELSKLRVQLTPLLLVQADSTEKSVERLKGRLLANGFTENQIAVHTADEPDAGLLALANDETREVLIFKMAVALGFDAPRAFTLVSMRASRDPDFGVQLVGRILRVHRRIQGRAQRGELPEPLRFGYVFLADAETQGGLDIAGQRINAIHTEYAKISPATIVVRVGDQPPMVQAVPDGQPTLFQLTPAAEGEGTARPASGVSPGNAAEFDLEAFFETGGAGTAGTTGRSSAASASEPAISIGSLFSYRYPLKNGVPKRFKTQTVSPNIEVTEEDCANKFIFSTRELFEALIGRIAVEKRTLEVFTQEVQHEFNFSADLSPERAECLAQKVLLRSEVFDPRELRCALLTKLQTVMRELAMADAGEPDKVRHYLNVILAWHPGLLHDAQKQALAETAELLEAEDLPNEWASEIPLNISRHNIYGVLPAELNDWERRFADVLDRDSNDIVRWWHRNLPHKPWSVNVLLPDGRGFYPDFVIGVERRRTEDHVLLADPKYMFEQSEQEAKVQAKHRSYGRVLILFLDGGTRWMTVGYNEKLKKAVLERELRLSDLAGF